MKIIFTEHAMFQMQRRKIRKEDVEFLIKSSCQKIRSKEGKTIFQNKYFDKILKKEMLLRVIGEERGEGFVVITVYKTSKIEKYYDSISENVIKFLSKTKESNYFLYLRFFLPGMQRNTTLQISGRGGYNRFRLSQ